MIPTDGLYGQIFDVSEDLEDEPKNDLFEEVGYEATLSMNNLGSLFLFMLLQPVQAIILKLIKKLNFYKKFKPIKKVKKFAKGQLKSIFWNGIISFYSGAYLVISMIGMINILDLRFGKDYESIEVFSSILAILFVIFAVTFPFCIGILFFRKLSKIEFLKLTDRKKYIKKLDKFFDKYGEMVSDFNLLAVDYSEAIIIPSLNFAHLFILIICLMVLKAPSFQV
jgi:hypothetical protein